MEITNSKFTKILGIIKDYIEEKYQIENLMLNKHSGYHISEQGSLTFYLKHKYYNVPIKITKGDFHIVCIATFKKRISDKRCGISGLAHAICSVDYKKDINDKNSYLKNLDFNVIDGILNDILQNMKEDGTWYDESQI